MNPKGFFENKMIRENVVKPYLKLCGADEMGQNPLPELNNLFELDGLTEKIEAIFLGQGYKEGPWYYKGAKLCLIWPIWDKAFPDAKWVIVRREDDDIINSCIHTGFMRAYNTAEGWQGWIDVHLRRFSEMKSSGLNYREVWPSKFVAGDYSEIQDVIEWLGLEFDESIVEDMVVPNKFKGGKSNGR